MREGIMSQSRSKRSTTRTSWEPVARWYNGWVGKHGSIYHQKIAIPTVLKLAELQGGERLIDIGCGQGVLAPHVVRAEVGYCGVDASRTLIQLARRYHGHQTRDVGFLQGDARDLLTLPGVSPEGFDVAVFMLSIQDMHPLDAVIGSASQVLAPGGRLIIFMTHPCFRVPRGSGWGFDQSRKLTYRRVDRYLGELQVPMKAYAEVTPHASGTTLSFHRPLGAYVKTLTQHGLVVDGLEELPDPLVGHRAPASHADIPLFAAFRARKLLSRQCPLASPKRVETL
jgi:SAM-dependent methyltransferase